MSPRKNTGRKTAAKKPTPAKTTAATPATDDASAETENVDPQTQENPDAANPDTASDDDASSKDAAGHVTMDEAPFVKDGEDTTSGKSSEDQDDSSSDDKSQEDAKAPDTTEIEAPAPESEKAPEKIDPPAKDVEDPNVVKINNHLATFVRVTKEAAYGPTDAQAQERFAALSGAMETAIRTKNFDMISDFINSDEGQACCNDKKAMMGATQVGPTLQARTTKLFVLFKAAASGMEMSFNKRDYEQTFPRLDLVDFFKWVSAKFDGK